MKYDLESCIKDSYEDTMESYLESDNHKEASWEFNKMYYKLRNRLLPEEAKMLDNIFNAMEEMNDATAKEAYHRGVVLGMSHSKKIFNKMELQY